MTGGLASAILEPEGSVISRLPGKVACLQRLGFDEAPLSDSIYRIGEPDEYDEEC